MAAQQQPQQPPQQQQATGGSGGGGVSPVDGNEPMPWPPCFLGCFPVPAALAASRCGRALLLPLSTTPPATKREWARVATLQSAGLLFLTLAIAAAESYLGLGTKGKVVLSGHVWLQVRSVACGIWM